MGDRSNPLIPYPISHKLRQRLSPFGNNKLVIISRARIIILMASSIDSQIQWIKDRIVEQVDSAIDSFTLVESGEEKTIEFSKIVVESIIHKIDVYNALDMYYYLQESGELEHIESTDRIQSLFDYFYAWIELELATRYA